MKVGDLFIALGFQVDDEKLKNFNAGIKDTTKLLGATAAAGTGAVYAINRFTASSVDSSVKLANLSAQTQTATEDVQRFYNVAGRLNSQVTLDDTINAFSRLSDTIADAKLGKGAFREAAMLGLDNIGAMTPIEIIKQLRANAKNNVASWGQGDKRVIQNLMEQIGVPGSMLQSILAPDEEFNKLWNNPILSGDARDKLVELAKAEKEVGIQWELTKGILSADFAPSLIEFLSNFNAVLGQTGELTGKVSSNIQSMADKKGLNDSQKRTVGNATALEVGLGLMAIPSPFFATQGAGALIIGGTAVNDVGKYIRGKPSTTQDLIQSFGDMHPLDAIQRTFSEELMKSQKEQEEDRRRILEGDPLPNKGIGRISGSGGNDNITMNVYGNGDARSTALAVVDLINVRQYRQMETDLGINSSGALA